MVWFAYTLRGHAVPHPKARHNPIEAFQAATTATIGAKLTHADDRDGLRSHARHEGDRPGCVTTERQHKQQMTKGHQRQMTSGPRQPLLLLPRPYCPCKAFTLTNLAVEPQHPDTWSAVFNTPLLSDFQLALPCTPSLLLMCPTRSLLVTLPLWPHCGHFHLPYKQLSPSSRPPRPPTPPPHPPSLTSPDCSCTNQALHTTHGALAPGRRHPTGTDTWPHRGTPPALGRCALQPTQEVADAAKTATPAA